MDRDGNPHPEPIAEGPASQFSPAWPTIQTALEAQAETQTFQDTYERFHALATVTGQIIWSAHPDGTAEDSPFWRAYTGQTTYEVQGLGWLNAIHPEDRERTRACWLQAVATRHFFETEYRIRRNDGVYHLFLVRGVPILDMEGNIHEWVGICTDISERKQLEQALQASETHFRASFEHAPVGIANATIEGQWFDVNQQLCDMLGYTREELLSRTFQEITHPDDLEASLEHHRRLLMGFCPSYTLEKRYLRKDGSPLWVNLTASLVRTAEGMPHHTIGIIEDISQRKQFEAERARLLEREQESRTQAEATARRLRAMQRLTDTALEHLSLEDLLHELLDRIREVMTVDATTILLLSEDRQFLTVYAKSGVEGAMAEQLHIPFGKGVAGTIAASQEPLLIEDISEVEVVDPFLREQICSLLGVPLLVKERVIGVLHVGTTQPHHYSQDDVQLLQTVAQRIALAIDHARLFQAEQQARADAAARASQLEATIEAMTEGVGIYTPEGFSLHTNHSGLKILGIDDPDRFRLFTSRHHPQRIALLNCRDKDGNPYPPERSPLTRALQGAVVPDAESEDMLITALDGHERYLSATAAPIRDAAGQLTGAVFVYRDVTERRLLEHRTRDALGALLEMAEALVGPSSAEEPLVEEDSHAEISTVTQRLAELSARVLGCEHIGIAVVDPETTQILPLAIITPDPEEEQGWWGRKSYAPRLCESSDPLWVERLRAGEVWHGTPRNSLFREPHPFKLPAILIAPMCVGKQLVGLLSIGHDNPEHIYTPQEIALVGAIAKLTALVIEREHLLRQREEARANELAIREANRQLETFLGMAAHELKTPLTSILMGQEMLQRRLQRLQPSLSGVAGDVVRQVEAIHALADTTFQQAGRLNRLVNDLLDTSRIQAGRLTLQIAPTDLAAIVRSAVEEQHQAAPERQMLLHLPGSGSVPILADAERIGQVVTNYLTNALKYSSEDRPVDVGVQIRPKYARVWVRDEGPGLPSEEQGHLWERFHRVPGIEIQCGSGIGLGIGLHISKTIIEQHGGQVGVQSTPGQGATFWFTLPREPLSTDAQQENA